MANQFSVNVRNGQLDQIESVTGASAVLRILTGSPPADCSAAETGTILAEMTLPSDWMAAASGGTKAKSGTWEDASANNNGTAGYYRIYNSGITTCHVQGTCGVSVVLTTNALTAANGNVLNFASTTGVVTGMNVSGSGIVAGTTVVALNATTVTLSHTSTAGVSNGASITFSYDMPINGTVTAGQTVTVGTYTWTAGNA